MTRVFYYMLVIFLLTLFACSNEENNQQTSKNGTIVIPVNLDYFQTLSLPDFIKSADIIALELTDRSGIDRVHKIIKTDSAIFVFNEIQTSFNNSLLKFDLNGRFLQKWDANTEGPKNFQHISDFIWTPEGSIEILDRLQQAIIEFDQNGNLIQRTKIDLGSYRFQKFQNGGYLLFRGNSVDYDPNLRSNKNLVYIDKNGKLLSDDGFVEVDPLTRNSFFNLSDFLYSSNQPDTYYFSDMFNDTIYFCNDQMVIPKYVLSFSNKKIFDAKYTSVLNEIEAGINTALLPDKIIKILNDPELIQNLDFILPQKNGFVTSFFLKKRRFFLFYNDQHQKATLFKLDHRPIWRIWPNAIDNEIIMCVNDPMAFKKDIERNSANSHFLQGVTDHITEASNPILFRINLDRVFGEN